MPLVALTLVFVFLAPPFFERRRIGIGGLALVVAATATAIPPSTAKWKQDQKRAAIAGIGTTAYAPRLAGWHVAEARVSWQTPWLLSLTVAPDGTPGSALHPLIALTSCTLSLDEVRQAADALQVAQVEELAKVYVP